MSDPYFSSVVLLVANDNAADGTTTFVDQSNSAHTMVAAGLMKYSTAQAPTGMTSSGLATNTGDSVASVASTDFSFAGDFTWECFAYHTSHATNQTLINIGVSDQFVWYIDTAAKVNYFDGSNNVLGANTMPDSTWTHLALVRSGTTLTSYIGGTAGNAPITVASTIGGNLALTLFYDLGSAEWTGNMASIRITKGVARYTADFTPPSLPLPITGAVFVPQIMNLRRQMAA